MRIWFDMNEKKFRSSEMPPIQSLALTREADGTIRAESFPKHIAISHELLDSHDKCMRVDGDRVTFVFANGTARYRETATDGDQNFSRYELIYLSD